MQSYPVWRGPAGDGITPGERDKIDEAVAAAEDLAVALPQVDQARDDAVAAADRAEAARTAAEEAAASAGSIRIGTQAQFEDAGSAVNGDGKATGIPGFDTTRTLPLWATGPAPNAAWVRSDGTVAAQPVAPGDPLEPWEDDVIFRASATSLNGLAPVTTYPTTVGNALRFDGVADAMTASVDFDLTGKTVLIAARANGVPSAAQAAMWALSGPLGYVHLEARNNPTGYFVGSHRAASGMAFGATQVTPATSFNTFVDHVGQDSIFVTRYAADAIAQISGELAGQTTTSSGIVRMVNAITIGRGGTNAFAAFDFYEIIVLDTTDRAIIQRAVDYLRVTYNADGPNVTRIFRADVAGLGDSISVGVGATGNNDFYRQTLKHFVATRTTNGFAGSQVSPYGLTDTRQIAAAFTNITNTATPFTGKGAVFASYGTNDYGAFHGGVPLGTPADQTDQTFNGALNLGWQQYLENSPVDQPMFVFTPVPRFDQTAPNAAGHVLLDYVQAIRAFVTRIDSPRLHLIDMWECGITNAETTDGLHPNDAGHARMADWAWPRIMSVLMALDGYEDYEVTP